MILIGKIARKPSCLEPAGGRARTLQRALVALGERGKKAQATPAGVQDVFFWALTGPGDVVSIWFASGRPSWTRTSGGADFGAHERVVLAGDPVAANLQRS